MRRVKRYFKLSIEAKRVIGSWLFVFATLSVLLVLACSMTNGTTKRNIEVSAYKMEEEGVYPRYLVNNPYYQLDNWTEAEVLNFIYSDYEGEPIKTAFSQRSKGGLYNGAVPVGDLERLLANIESDTDMGESIRPAYWVGSRIFLIPLLQVLDYYQIRTLFFVIASMLLFLTVILLCKKVNVKLGIGLLSTFIMINCPIAFLNNSLGLLCMCLTLSAIIYLIYNRNRNDFQFMLVIGMLAVYFDWFSLSIFSFGILAVVMMVLQYLQNPETEFVTFFNKIWNCAIGWIAGVVSMFAGRVAISTLVAGSTSMNYFVDRLSYNTGVQGGKSMLLNIVSSLAYCILGIFPFSSVLKSGNGLKIRLVVIAIALVIFCVYVLMAVAKKSKYLSFNCGLLIIAFSPIVWIIVLNTYYYVHWWIGYRVLGISVFAVLCILLFGLDSRKLKRTIVES